ncbi:hypothetical protein [Methylomagnum sp.]
MLPGLTMLSGMAGNAASVSRRFSKKAGVRGFLRILPTGRRNELGARYRALILAIAGIESVTGLAEWNIDRDAFGIIESPSSRAASEAVAAVG